MTRFRYGGFDRAALDLLDSPRASYMFQVSSLSPAPAAQAKQAGPVAGLKDDPPVGTGT